MRRRAIHILAALSLLICLALDLVWVRSLLKTDEFSYATTRANSQGWPTFHSVLVSHGAIEYQRVLIGSPTYRIHGPTERWIWERRKYPRLGGRTWWFDREQSRHGPHDPFGMA